MLKLYNTYSNKKEDFVPIDSNRVRMYVCGPTVYGEIHVGNARSVLVFDLLYRVLRREYDCVDYARNITDIDDKIIKRANDECTTSAQVAKTWEESFKQNYKKLNALEPNYQPRATDTIEEIIASIGELVEQDFAYEEEGHVLFRVSAIEEYGALSKQNNLIDGARVAVGEYKEDSRDFVLWKPSKLGEPYWNSPWGKGRPGWHIECTAMSAKLLGKSFDIHGGGQDLLFPHHENEQAQNIGLYGKYAGPRYWVHNAMVLFENQKMSKSLGNIVRLSDAFALYDPMIIRFFILSTYYRHALIWKDENIQQAASRYKRWMYHLSDHIDGCEISMQVYDALLDDLNTPLAFAIFDQQLADALRENDVAKLRQLANTLNFFGLFVKKEEDAELMKILEEKLMQRRKARADKNFALADKLREEIESAGYDIIDTQGRSCLKKKL